MTVTTPENGFRARLQRLARGAVVLAMAVGAGAFGTPAAADTADADSGDPGVELFVSAGIHGVVVPGGAVSTSFMVRNETESELSDGRIVVELNRTPLSDAAAVTTWLGDEEAAGAFETVWTEATDAVEAGATTSNSTYLEPEVLGELAPGVYPVRAALSGATTTEGGERVTQDASASSLLVISAAQPQAAVLVPITAAPADGALLTLDELTELTATDGALTAQLDGVAGTSAVLAVDPAIPAAIRALGTSAPTRVTVWLERLEGLPNERFALQFADADPATQAHAGLPELLQPASLTPFLDPVDFATAPTGMTPSPGPTSTTTPEPTPTPTEGPQLPDDAALTALARSAPGILWPNEDVSTADLATFARYVEDEVTTIVSSNSVGAPVGGHAEQDGHDLLVSSDAASDALSRAATEPSAIERQRWLAAANAHLLLAGQATASAPVVLALDRDETRTADALREAVTAADPIGLDQLRALPATPVTLNPPADAAARAASLQTLLDDEGALNEFSTILEDPQVLLSPERIRLLRTIRVGTTDAEFADAVAMRRSATADTLAAVGIPPSSTIQLLTANADLPLPVRNELPWPVSIRLSVAPTDPRLDVQSVTETVVPASSSVRVKVPVSARVGSGEVDLRLSLSSPTGVSIGDQQTVRVAVRAEWETIGLAVFGGLIVVLIALGVLRTVRRRRREAAAGSETDAAVTGPVPNKDGREYSDPVPNEDGRE